MPAEVILVAFVLLGSGITTWVQIAFGPRTRKPKAVTSTQLFRAVPGLKTEDYEWVKNMLLRAGYEVTEGHKESRLYFRADNPFTEQVEKPEVPQETLVLGSKKDAAKMRPPVSTPSTTVPRSKSPWNHSSVTVPEDFLEKHIEKYRVLIEQGRASKRDREAFAVLSSLQKEQKARRKATEEVTVDELLGGKPKRFHDDGEQEHGHAVDPWSLQFISTKEVLTKERADQLAQNLAHNRRHVELLEQQINTMV